MRIVFAGTPAFAAVSLHALIGAGYLPSLVLTQPDRPAGRGMKTAASAVAQAARARDLPLAQPESLKTPGVQQMLAQLDADIMVVAAYGLILPRALLSVPRLGCINVHASLLPRWRGAAPVARAILAGDERTGISIMQMESGLDAGPVLLREMLEIAPRDSAASLLAKLAQLGGGLVVRALAKLERGGLGAEPQDEAQATYAPKLTKGEAVIDWRESAQKIDRAVRAFNPVPVAHATLNGVALKVWEAEPAGFHGAPGEVLRVDADGIVVACGEGALRITRLQRPGGKILAAREFLRGYPVRPGERLFA